MTEPATLSKTKKPEAGSRVDPGALKSFVAALFAASGSERGEAVIVADHLVESNLRGHDSHGVLRVSKYVDWVRQGALLPNQHASIVSDRGALLTVDGGFGYGQVIGREAMTLAADRARQLGMCAIAIRNAGHLGRVGAWAEQLADAGFVSMHFVNTSGFGILVAPHGGSDRRLSANPIAAGAPMPGRPPIILDIATSLVAEGKIQVARNKGESLEPGWVTDGQGRPTTDPAAFYRDPPGAIFPIAGHKGSGLSIMCELLAGSLTGGGSSHPKNESAWRLVNNMMTICFDPSAFPGADFVSDVLRLSDWVKASPPIRPGGTIALPGEIEAAVTAERSQNGIPLDPETLSQLIQTAKSLSVPVPPELSS